MRQLLTRLVRRIHIGFRLIGRPCSREGVLFTAAALALVAWALLAAPTWAASAGEGLPDVRSGGKFELNACPPVRPVIADECRQMVLVVGDSWDSLQGRMALFTRSGPKGRWKAMGRSFPVVLGKNGLAWGLGLHGRPQEGQEGPVKREGDGKAPAGAFLLGPAFARDPAELGAGVKVDVLDLRDKLVCVDSERSRFYNRLLPQAEAQPQDFDSFEDMWKVGERYRYGVLVEHNSPEVTPGAGSCIFLHIWLNPQSGTAGCTAMESGRMRALIRSLDRVKHPVLVQLPRIQYQRLRAVWNLPELP